MSAPAIEFHVIGPRCNFHDIRSSNDAIRFRVERQARRTVLDADWYNTRLELSHSAWRQITSAWRAECIAHPCKRGDAGGGKSCAILTVAPDREEFWREFLRDLLSRPQSWLTWDDRRAFIPTKPL